MMRSSGNSASIVWRKVLCHHRAIMARTSSQRQVHLPLLQNYCDRCFHSSKVFHEKHIVSKLEDGIDDDDDDYDDYDNDYVDEEDEAYLSLPIDEQLKFIADQEMRLRKEERQMNPKPWSNLLGCSAKAKWRVTSSFPDVLTDERSAMLEETHRTSRQIKRAFAKIIEKQQKLAAIREVERKQDVMGKQSRRNQFGQDPNIVTYGPEQTFVSISHRLLPNFAITQRVLEETRSILGPSFHPKKVIDFGCGCGSASAAAINVFQNSNDNGKNIEWVHGIDPSASQREAAQRILSAMKSNITSTSSDNVTLHQSSMLPRITMGESISSDTTTRAKTSEYTQGTFDLALFCYTAQEIASDATNLAAAAILWEKLSDGGIFVMIEPGTPDGFNSVRCVREMLLECCPPNGLGTAPSCHVIAPCTHNGKCPMDRFLNVRNDRLDVGETSIISSKSNVNSKKGNETLNEGEHGFVDSFGDDDSGDWTLDEFEQDFDENDDDEFDDMADDEKDWFEKEFQTIIVEGKIFEEGGNFWRNKPIAVAKTSRKGAHIENTNIFDDSFCGFPHLIPGGAKMGEKFSYIVLQKRSSKSSNKNETTTNIDCLSETNIVSLLKDSFDNSESDGVLKRAVEIEDRYMKLDADPLGLDFVQGENRQNWGKLVRAPIKKKGHIIVDFCTGDDVTGKIVRHRVGRAKAERAAPGMYTAARKARWGGYWPDLSKHTTT